MKNRDILISGASIAGPALAYWLRRRGFNPTVVERAPALREGGYAIDFRGSVYLGMLESMGVLERIQRESTQMGDMIFVNERDQEVARLPAGLFSGDVEILRGDLARILYDATREDTEYLFGDSITGITQDEDKVQVTFAKGSPRMFDLVMGADGLHSNVRSLVFGEESRFVKTLGAYTAIFTTSNRLNLDHSGHLYFTPGRMAGMYSARNNTEAKATFNFHSPPIEYDRHDVAQQKRIVTEKFSDLGWEVPWMLEAMRSAPDFYFDSFGQVIMDRWSSGRTVLVGDAAYCPSPRAGMGTGLAMVGAYVLAGELEAAGGDHTRAFASYEQQLRAYVEEIQRTAQQGGDWFMPHHWPGIWLRNLFLRAMPYLPTRSIDERARDRANTLVLKDYLRKAEDSNPRPRTARTR